VEKDPSKQYAVVKAKPTANLETSREVLLVWTEEAPRVADESDYTPESESQMADAVP
jgi:cell shape-determining protein MreC